MNLIVPKHILSRRICRKLVTELEECEVEEASPMKRSTEGEDGALWCSVRRTDTSWFPYPVEPQRGAQLRCCAPSGQLGERECFRFWTLETCRPTLRMSLIGVDRKWLPTANPTQMPRSGQLDLSNLGLP